MKTEIPRRNFLWTALCAPIGMALGASTQISNTNHPEKAPIQEPPQKPKPTNEILIT